MIEAFLRYEFLQNAVVISVIAAFMCAFIGVVSLEKKTIMLSGGIAHASYGGVGLGYLLGIEPMIGAAAFAIGSAFVIGYIDRKAKRGSDFATALLWSFGMALGIVFISLMPGYPPDIDSYLFGSILTVTKMDIYISLPIALIIGLLFIVFFNDWKSYLFDSSFASILGIKTLLLENLLLLMTALTVVVLIKATGIILVIALLSAPASCASLISKSLKGRIIKAFLFGIAFCLSGIALSYEFSVPSGASIVFVAVITYFSLFIGKKIIAKR